MAPACSLRSSPLAVWRRRRPRPGPPSGSFLPILSSPAPSRVLACQVLITHSQKRQLKLRLLAVRLTYRPRCTRSRQREAHPPHQGQRKSPRPACCQATHTNLAVHIQTPAPPGPESKREWRENRQHMVRVCVCVCGLIGPVWTVFAYCAEPATGMCYQSHTTSA